MTRRSLRAFLASLALIAVAACTTSTASTTNDPSTAAPSSPRSVVQPSVPTFTEDPTESTKTPIKHVVILMMENRSFDHMFGSFPGADGVSAGWDLGVKRPLTHVTAQRIPDLPHCWQCAVASYDGGKMDGFNQTLSADHHAYTQLQAEDEPNYWTWAKHYTLADRFFSSERGPSYANHLYMISGQSAGAHDNPSRHKVHSLTWGCDSPPKEKVRVVHEDGSTEWVHPCFKIPSIEDRLREAGIPWAYYAATSTQPGYIWSAFTSIHDVFYGPNWDDHVFPVDQVSRDLSQVSLPAVTWIMPRFELSNHPGGNFCYGENWATKVIDTIMRSPDWSSTAIFLTWDEWGGFYDHVPPPTVDGFGYGFRVPLLVLSPYAKQHFIDHHTGSFDSILRFIEMNWGLKPLTERDRDASDLMTAFDFAREPAPADPLPLRTDCHGPKWEILG
jgi:phospholipase C